MQHAELQKSQQQAATLLQGLYRGFKDRKTVKQVRMQHALEKLKLQDLFGWGATMIQKAFRAYVGAGACCGRGGLAARAFFGSCDPSPAMVLSLLL